jgi:hypothetical protein
LREGVGADEGEDGVAVAEQLGDDGGPDQAGAASDEDAAVAASSELQERDALKSVSLAAAMTAALAARGVPDPVAALAGELGVLAFKRGYAEWSEGDRGAGDELAGYVLAALEQLRAASASLR